MTKSIDDFSNILQRDQSLAPYTWLRLGGPAEYLLTPRTEAELLEVVRYCLTAEISIRILGGGSNLLVADEGISGAVIRITDSLLNSVEIKDQRLTAGGGNSTFLCCFRIGSRAQLSGLEVLVGIPGTVGGGCGG